jgi:hypothetical protein
MAAPRLTPEQRDALLSWLAAEYSEALICKWFEERKWTPPAASTLSYYRRKWADQIEAARAERRSSALTTGLALKEERVRRLAAHADELEVLKWKPDKKSGRLWNEKAWRETLDDIARELGHRRQGVDVSVAERELEAFLDRLQGALEPEVYARVLALAAGGEAPERTP